MRSPLRRRIILATAVGCLLATAAIAPQLAAAPARADTSATVVIDPVSSGTGHPWLGYGVEVQAENDFCDNPAYDPPVPCPADLTPAQYTTLFQRLDYLRPALARTWMVFSDFCTDASCDGYNWGSSMMTPYYEMWDHLKADGIPFMITMGVDTSAIPWKSAKWASVMADLYKELITVKGYTNLEWWDGHNEPNCGCGNTPGNVQYTLTDWETADANERAAFNADGLSSEAFMGPTFDGAQGLPGATVNAANLGAYDTHNYATDGDIADDAVETTLNNLVLSTDTADPTGKPVGLSEMGDATGSGGSCDCQPNRTTFAYGLSMANYGVQIARSGMSFASAWELDDQGPDNQWGMFDSRSSGGTYPWFYSWSMLTRYFPAGATIYRPRTEPSGLNVIAARTSAGAGNGNWSVALVNTASTGQDITVSAPGAGSGSFNQYDYESGSMPVGSTGLPVPATTVSGNLGAGITVDVPAGSFIVLTTMDGSPLPDSSFTSASVHYGSLPTGQSGGPPAAASQGSNNEDLFYASGGSVDEVSWNGSGWGSPVNLGAPPAGVQGNPSATSRPGTGYVNVYVRGGDNAIWVDGYYAGAWHGWSSLGGDASDDPSSAAGDSTNEYVFIRDASGDLQADTWNGSTWSGFTSLGTPAGGAIQGRPAAVSRPGSATIDIYARGADNALWDISHYNGAWQSWHSYGQTLTGPPTAAAWDAADEDVVFPTAAGLRDFSYNGVSWSGVSSLGAPSAGIDGPVTSVARQPGYLNVYLRGGDGDLYEASYYNGYWH